MHLLPKEQKFYLDDGCHSEGEVVGNPNDDVVGSFKPKSFEAGVRCCANDGNSCTTKFSCDKESGNMSYDNAVSSCAAMGRRLCTKVELLSDICCRTGGNCDNYAVWTSTSECGILLFRHIIFLLRVYYCLLYTSDAADE